MNKQEIQDYINCIKKLADELQKHAEEISSDKYGSQEITLKKAWSYLEIVRQDYFPQFDYEKALFTVEESEYPLWEQVFEREIQGEWDN